MKNQVVKVAGDVGSVTPKTTAEGLVGRAVNAIVDDIRANGLRKGDLLPSESAE